MSALSHMPGEEKPAAGCAAGRLHGWPTTCRQELSRSRPVTVERCPPLLDCEGTRTVQACAPEHLLATSCNQPQETAKECIPLPTSTDAMVRGGAPCLPLAGCSTGIEKLRPSLLSCKGRE